MHLISRKPRHEDFDGFFWNCFHGDRFNVGLRQAVGHEWRVFLDSPTTLAVVVEGLDREPGRRIVGCAMSVFVTDRFVHWANSGVDPEINRAAAKPLVDGCLPLLDEAQVARANKGHGLNVLLARWGWAHDMLGVEECRRVQEYLQRSALFVTRGYRFKEMLVECVGEGARDRALAAGFRLRTDYAAYYRRNPPSGPHTYLLGVTSDEALASDGSIIYHVFTYTPRQLGLKPHEQELVRRALEGETDEALAASLYAAVPTVKSWWRNIYRRIQTAHPMLLAGDAEETEGRVRGKEKRRIVLNYLREHPEELCPY